jgi:uncharacterized Fe-S center protein
MKKVVFFTDENKIGEALDNFNIEGFKGKKIPFKLHMGEKGNEYFPSPTIVKPFIKELKKRAMHPFFYDTTVAYSGLRHLKKGYEKLAKKHGYTELGFPIIIDDTGIKVNVEGREYEVGTNLYNSSHVFGFSHFKGHIATGMGGAIKNFGMGGVTKENKRSMHNASKPVFIKDNCTFCGVCAEVCPFDAIEVSDNKWNLFKSKCFGCGVCVDNCNDNCLINEDKNLHYLLACAAKACVQDKNVLYLNELRRISRSCDCDPFAGPLICPDIGFLLSDDIVAVDKASLDLINDIKKDVFIKENKVDPLKQIKYSEEIGLGSTSYQLIEI